MESDEFNPYKVRVTLLAPAGKGPILEHIITKLISWVDPSFQIVRVEERMMGDSPRRGHHVTRKSVTKHQGKLVTPALSVMLFMQEAGSLCVKDVETELKKPPWTFHHSVELQNKSSPSHALAKQEFYRLADDQPLWTACPIPTGNEHLRISIYVHNFNNMVEFYRAVTDTEIETNKPEFCIFQLYTQSGLDIQLSLKHSRYIHPVPVDSAYLSFNVPNIAAVKLGANCDITHVNGNVFTTRDPDGNLVVLYETYFSERLLQQQQCAACCSSLGTSTSSYETECSCCSVSSHFPGSLDDLKSCKSSTDSHDSGRCSDMDVALPDNVFVSEPDLKTCYTVTEQDDRNRDPDKGIPQLDHDHVFPAEMNQNPNKGLAAPKQKNRSEGYCSSASSTGSGEFISRSTKGKAPVKRTANSGKRHFKSSKTSTTETTQEESTDQADERSKSLMELQSRVASMYI